MRIAIALVVCALLALIAFVVNKERTRGQGRVRATITSSEPVLTISTGERVDIEAHVGNAGLTIVEFTADF